MSIAVLADAQNVAGHYVLKGVHEVGSELLIKPDKTFEYMLAYGAADYQAAGSWRVEDGYLILSTAGNEEPAFKLIRSSAAPGKAIEVKVVGPGGRPAQHIDVVLRGGTEEQMERTSEEGVARFENGGREVLFRIPVYDLEAGPFAVAAPQNRFEFEINGAAITTVRFKDEKLRIKGGALEMLFWSRDKPMVYERARR